MLGQLKNLALLSAALWSVSAVADCRLAPGTEMKDLSGQIHYKVPDGIDDGHLCDNKTSNFPHEANGDEQPSGSFGILVSIDKKTRNYQMTPFLADKHCYLWSTFPSYEYPCDDDNQDCKDAFKESCSTKEKPMGDSHLHDGLQVILQELKVARSLKFDGKFDVSFLMAYGEGIYPRPAGGGPGGCNDAGNPIMENDDYIVYGCHANFRLDGGRN